MSQDMEQLWECLGSNFDVLVVTLCSTGCPEKKPSAFFVVKNILWILFSGTPFTLVAYILKVIVQVCLCAYGFAYILMYLCA